MTQASSESESDAILGADALSEAEADADTEAVTNVDADVDSSTALTTQADARALGQAQSGALAKTKADSEFLGPMMGAMGGMLAKKLFPTRRDPVTGRRRGGGMNSMMR